MKTTFTAEKFGDNWSEIVEQLKEKFYAALRYGDVVVATDSPYLSEWAHCNYSFETTWFDDNGNEYTCAFNIDEELSSITVEGCEWTFDWEDGPSEKVEIYKLNPIEPDLSDIDVQKDVISEIVESAKLHGLYLACLSSNVEFIENAGMYFGRVQRVTEDNEVSAWFEIYNKRYPFVPRDNEQMILSFNKQFGDDDPKEILSANLTQEEFDELVNLKKDCPTNVVSQIISDAKVNEVYKAIMRYKGQFVQYEEGSLIATVLEKSENNDVSAWLEIKTYRFPIVERENETQELIFWKRVGDNNPEELLYVKLNDEEFNELVNA